MGGKLLRAAGYNDATPIIVGSSVTGYKYGTNIPFRESSDLDFAIISEQMIAMIQTRRDLGWRAGLTHENDISGLLDEEDLKLLGLEGLIEELKLITGRKKIKMRIYKNREALDRQDKEWFNFLDEWQGM